MGEADDVGEGRVTLTGSTGFVGGRVARLCSAAGMPVSLLVRDASRAPVLRGTDVRTFSGYGGADAARALAGTQVLFMVSAAEQADRLREHDAFVDAAAAAGVEHVIYLSFFGASPVSTFTLARDHWATEQRIRASGMRWTFLRDNLYLDFLPLMVGTDGALRGPAGTGRAAAVARADVARCAAAVLGAPAEHVNRTYDLTGPDAISMPEACAILSEHLGHQVRFVDETIEEARASRAAWNPPEWQMQAWITTYLAIARGELEAVSGDVEALTGRRPLSLRQLLDQGRTT